MVNPSYQSEVSEIRFLIGAANTQELRNQVRTRIAELITNTSALLSKLAEDLGFDLVKSGRRRITRLMLEEELERRFPPLRNPQEDELPVPIEFEKRNEIFLPPETQEPRSGESEFVPPRVFPRTRLAIEVLERMGLDLSNCIFMEGINVPNMMRTLSYRAIVITEIQKAILVCDEERNKTFIIYESENIERYYRLRKNELKDLSSQGIVADLIWCEPEKWQARLEDLLRSRPEHIQPEEPPEEVPDAPEGWMTNSALAREIGVTHRVVKRMAKEYREEHPEWFVRYRFGTGRGRGSYEHFSPELCDIIRARINEYEIAPEGWMTNSALVNELEVSDTLTKKIANKYHETNPEWSARYRLRTGKSYEAFVHYSPELCDIIRARINEYETAPEGWMTNSALANELEVSYTLTKKIANKYRQTNSEWFREYKHKMGHIREHYSPELCNIIRARINEYETAPEGWLTNSTLAKGLDVDWTTIQKLIQPYRQTHPQWFVVYNINEHFSPELCDIIRTKINEYETAPEGWLTNGGLADELNVANDTTKRRAEVYRKEYPEWFREYKTTGKKGGVVREHFSPELCDI
ncbi:hypothetical protein JW752_02365, partial [Candidatus Peregrinibacteria bacterium]|nr:hypothetical protein [Candidatus Peregrinibacteria bacterium]